MYSSFELSGTCRTELNTEMRFLLAGAKVDGAELVRLCLPVSGDEKEDSRVNCCAIKVLRTLKKENVIQFYVNKEGFSVGSTEASFLLNKYGEYISDPICAPGVIYVKL